MVTDWAPRDHRDARIEELEAENERLRADVKLWQDANAKSATARDQYEARIEAAMTLHKQGIWTGTIKCCLECSKPENLVLWPCPTVRALRGGDE
jgi:hypothetical protein